MAWAGAGAGALATRGDIRAVDGRVVFVGGVHIEKRLGAPRAVVARVRKAKGRKPYRPASL